MSEHRIRLRGAWDCNIPGDEDMEEISFRVDLPTAWSEETRFPLHLVRRFGRPPLDPERERVELEFRSVPGLISIRLNGSEIPLPDARGDGELSIELDRTLLPRNALMLELDERARQGPPDGWGEIAIKISPRPEKSR